MPPLGFEPSISASERPQTYSAATGTGTRGSAREQIIMGYEGLDVAIMCIEVHK